LESGAAIPRDIVFSGVTQVFHFCCDSTVGVVSFRAVVCPADAFCSVAATDNGCSVTLSALAGSDFGCALKTFFSVSRPKRRPRLPACRLSFWLLIADIATVFRSQSIFKRFDHPCFLLTHDVSDASCSLFSFLIIGQLDILIVAKFSLQFPIPWTPLYCTVPHVRVSSFCCLHCCIQMRATTSTVTCMLTFDCYGVKQQEGKKTSNASGIRAYERLHAGAKQEKQWWRMIAPTAR
jgi:hypothetical protein